MRVAALTSSPLHTEILDPTRVADAITVARRGFDFIVVDLHPSYSTLNQAIFERADRILVPVTPDVPAIRAAVHATPPPAVQGSLFDRRAIREARTRETVAARLKAHLERKALALSAPGGERDARVLAVIPVA